MKKQTFAWIMTLIMIVSLFAQNASASEITAAEESKETSAVTESVASEQETESVASEQETESTKEEIENSSETEAPENDSQTEDSSSTESTEESSAVSEPAESKSGESSSENETDVESTAEPADEPTDETTVEPEPTPTEDPAALIPLEDPEPLKYADIKDGYYKVVSSAGSAKVLDVQGGSRDNYANIQIYSSNRTAAQIFKIEGTEETADGITRKYYLIRSYNNLNEVLDVVDGKNVDYTNVQQYRNHNAKPQKWYITIEDDNTYCIRSMVSGIELTRVLEVKEDKNSANVYINSYSGAATQKWTFEEVIPYEPKEGLYTIVENSTKKVMDVANNSPLNGANLNIYKSNGTPAQQFYLKKAGYGGFYSLISVSTRNAVDIKDNKSSAGTNLQLYKFKGNKAQLFRFEKTSSDSNTFSIITSSGTFAGTNGSNVELASTASAWYLESISGNTAVDAISSGMYYIVPKSNGDAAVDIVSGSVAEGAKAQIYTKTAVNAQIYKLTFSNGLAKFQNIGSGKYLGTQNNAKKNLTRIIQTANSDAATSKWKIIPTNDGDGSVYLRLSDTAYSMDIADGKTTNGTAVQLYGSKTISAQKFYIVKAITKTGWQTFMGGKRYVYDEKGNYYKNTTIDGIVVGPDGTTEEWVYTGGFWRFKKDGVLINDVRPYLTKLFGSKTVPTKSLPNFTEPAVSAPATPGYYATLDRTRCIVTIYTKYPGTNSWNLPVCAFKCSPGMNDTPTDPGTRWTVANARWSELMGPSYGQYTTRLSKPGVNNKWSGELFHSVPCGKANDHNVPRGMYNSLGKKASHGCVRMDVRNCYWICKFCPKGMMVKVGDNYNAPIKAVPQPKMRSGNVDPTDPAYTGNYGYVDTNVYYGDYYF